MVFMPNPRTLVGGGYRTGAIFQALRCFGKDRIDGRMISRLADISDDDDRVQLSGQSKHIQAWMRPVVQQIVVQT